MISHVDDAGIVVELVVVVGTGSLLGTRVLQKCLVDWCSHQPSKETITTEVMSLHVGERVTVECEVGLVLQKYEVL